MIGTLARKRTNWAALAVLAALVAAMFVALQSASAAGCVTNPNIVLGTGDTCEVVHDGFESAESSDTAVATVTATPDADATNDIPDGQVTITAVTIGTATITLRDNGVDDTANNADDVTVEYEVTVAGFAISALAVKGDSDNVVSAGPQVTVTAKLRSAVGTSAVRLTVPTTGLSIHDPGATDAATDDSTTQTQTKTVTAAGTQTLEFIVNTAGAPAGDYALTFTADQDGNFATRDGATEAAKQATQALTLTIGDPGMGLASATLSLGNSAEDLPYTDANEAVPETGSAAAAGGSINLVVEAFDSLGGKANSSAVNQIIVIAPGGTITSTHDTGANDTSGNDITAGGSSSATLSEVDADTSSADDVGDVGQRTVITVSKADSKPGTVTVYAIVSGPGGAARTEDVTLTFAGQAASMSIADASESLLSVNTLGDNPETDAVEEDFVIKDTIKLVVTAEDAGGNTTAPPTSNVSIVITDPDGKRQGTSVIGRSQPTKVGPRYLITLTGNGTATAPLKAGNWTLIATSGKLEATATFAVAGPPADVAVSASQTSSDTIGDVITVTASVTDKDGNTVSDGTTVSFSASTGTGLAAIGTGHSGKASKNGEASVKYAVVGAGNSVVSATAGDATGVVVIVSTAGTAAAEAEEVGISCLSRLSSHSVWTCETGANASDIFAALASRDASALWLHNGSRWVRYATRDGEELPGSTDFEIRQHDNLYISY